MPTTISLGFDPLPLEVRLAPDSDFAAALVAEGGWPAGARIELQFRRRGDAVAATWVAVIDGDTASWSIPAVQVAAVIEACPRQVRLHYRETDDGPTLLWASGPVDSR